MVNVGVSCPACGEGPARQTVCFGRGESFLGGHIPWGRCEACGTQYHYTAEEAIPAYATGPDCSGPDLEGRELPGA